MIWVSHSSLILVQEVDDDLDKHVSKAEFEKMYKRCISDQSGLEP